MPPGTLFHWVGFQNFTSVFDVANSATRATTFVELAKWTLVWAVCATFTNYILGMIIALMINKKGIKFKALWRTLFVIAIAVPQFVSLLLMNQMLQTDGAFNVLLTDISRLFNPDAAVVEIQWLNTDPNIAKIVVSL